MSGVACDTCGAKLLVEITGGSFYIREGSTLENLNFEKTGDNRIITTLDEPKEGDEDTSLTVTVTCTADRSHGIFAHTVSKIKCDIYGRIVIAAKSFIKKHYS